MANGVKSYTIIINGVQQSVDAVESLNKQLDTLEQRIDALSKKNVNVSAKVSGSSTKELKQEEALLKKIDQLHKKVADTERKEYQELLHAKEELKEYQTIAKAIAAEQNISSGVNNPNTMLGMKAQLRDIKAAMQIVDVDSDKFKQMQKQANDLNEKLLQIEKGYGQFGRNVGRYSEGVAEGMQKVKVQVGDTTREFNSAREASRTLNNELKAMALNGQQDTKAYKDLDAAVKQVNSTISDTSKSSKMMDTLLDTMQGMTAISSIGVGFSKLFGIDDSDFNDTMQKFAALTLAMQGIEKLKLQITENEGMGKIFNVLSKPFNALGEKISNFTKKAIDDFDTLVTKSTKAGKRLQELGYEYGEFYSKVKDKKVKGWHKEVSREEFDEMVNSFIEAQKFAKSLNLVHKGIKAIASVAKIAGKAISGMFTLGIGMVFIEVITKVMDTITDFVKSLNTTKIAADRAAESMNKINRQLQIQRDILSSNYLKKAISDEQYLNGIYKSETDALIKQIDALRTLAKERENNASGWGRITNALDATQNTEFSGKRLTSETTVGRGRLTTFWNGGNDLEVTVKDIKELENAWNQCNEALSENKDYLSKWGSGVADWFSSLFATVKDTEEVMRGLGNVGLGDFISRFEDINKQFNKGELNAKEYAAELAKLRNEMNNSEILNSVIANLDKYIPDERVRNAVQNIINEIYRLDDAFNMTSAEQIHYWNQVRIDAMKDGYAKEMAQIQENERYEIQQKAYTEEQKTLLQKKYDRQRQNARDKANKDALSKAKEHGKKLQDAENELIALRIENMKEGLDKELAQIENERRLAIQKARESGTKSGEIIMQINLKYDQKILDQKRRWAAEIIKIYEDMLARIEQVNKQTFEIEVETATQNTEMKQSEALRKSGYEMITPSTYDDTKALEAYYKKVMDIEKKYLDIQTEIQRESLEKQLDYTKAEEELRHRRATDPNDNEFLQQLRAGKITQEEYDKLIEDENTAHTARMNAIDKKYASDLKKLTEDNLQNTLDLYTDYFDKIVNGVAEERAKIDEVVSQPLILDNDGWGIVNVTKNRQRFKQALSQYEELKKGIIEKQKELKNALDTSGITAEDFAIEQKALDDEMKAIDNAVTNIKQSSKSLLGDFFQSIQQYVQAVGQAATSIIQSIGEINDAAFEKQIEAIEKENELLEEKLNKQKELTQQYADDVEGIEDELANSRGDRRQHLIDQLNAQMAAQRESLAQEKRIEKEQERLDAKRKKLEEDNNKRKKSQAITTALINAALAISNAAVNTWPIPAVPMMALAAAVGAAQVAAVKAAKYADGGVLQGKSHRQGGIKVLGGSAEVEGGEYITNKRTTAKNVDLLDYINSKKRRVDLSDLIEFYADKPKSIRNITKKYFADGGQLPSLRNDININDRILTAMEQYNERPIYVEVTEIMNKADDVRRVQTLAGL